MIGPYCYITDHDHGYARGTPIASQPLVQKPVCVGNNVWIGAAAIILKGVVIGDDVSAGAKFVGVPARQIGQRKAF